MVDFAPHQVEFLRDAHADERLGFSTGQVAEWMRGSGLELTKTVELAPADAGTDRLSVMLWLATKPVVTHGNNATENLAIENKELLEEI